MLDNCSAAFGLWLILSLLKEIVRVILNDDDVYQTSLRVALNCKLVCLTEFDTNIVNFPLSLRTHGLYAGKNNDMTAQ